MPTRPATTFILFTLCLLGCPAFAAPPSVTEAADRAISLLKVRGVAGEVAIAQRQGPIEDRVVGLANREQKTPHRRGQTWLWASVTKQVSATLVLQQVRKGSMALDAPISLYLQDFSGSRDLTIRSLLQHQTDLPNPDETPVDKDGVPAFYLGAATGDANRSAAGGYCAGRGHSNPDRKFRYNNCDYLVLGAALEQVSGMDFGNIIETKLNRGLGLSSVGLAGPDATDVRGYDGSKPYPPINPVTFGASGAMKGSVADLVRFDIALLGESVLESPQKTLAWKGDPALGYEGLGVWAFQANLHGCSGVVDLVERRGDIGGIQVRNVIAPGLGRAMAVFTNDAAIDFGEIWQGQGLTYDLLSAVLCNDAAG